MLGVKGEINELYMYISEPAVKVADGTPTTPEFPVRPTQYCTEM